MFYVKGSTFVTSLSPTAVQEVTETQENHEASVLLQHYHDANTTKAVAFLPVCFIGAAVLCLLSVLYTAFLMPTILYATALANVSPAGLPDGANNTWQVPLPLTCQRLPKRSDGGAKTVKDLRPDDIRVVLGIGDSVMAGFGAKGIQNDRFISIKTLREDRGVSFAMGGDPGATTLPNIIRYFTPSLYGPSVGHQLFTICFGDQFCPDGQYKSKIDVLNAAQSGARSLNLNHEIDYLLDELDDAYKDGRIQPTDWKLLTFFIGSNDICHACAVPTSLPPVYIANVAAAIQRVRATIRNVLVQIVGVMRVDQIFIETQNFPEYCQPFPRSDFVLHDHECMCAHSAANRTIMSTLTPQYNMGLEDIVKNSQSNDSFAVVYQPLKVDIMSFPIEAISNVDCFHPSELAHAWLAKELWRMMFLPLAQKQYTLQFDVSSQVYCPSETDRFKVN